jgi:hypothetical protein
VHFFCSLGLQSPLLPLHIIYCIKYNVSYEFDTYSGTWGIYVLASMLVYKGAFLIAIKNLKCPYVAKGTLNILDLGVHFVA